MDRKRDRYEDIKGVGSLFCDLYSVAGLAAANGRLEEAYVYDTYGEAVIEGRPVGQGPDDGGWPKGDPDLGRWAALAAGGECGHN